MSNKPTSVIFEKGITLRRVGKSWRCITARNNLSLGPRALSAHFRVRPILKTVSSHTKGHETTILLHARGCESLTSRVAHISNGPNSVQFFPYNPLRVGYTLREVNYHCQRLAENCSNLCVKCIGHPIYGQIQDDSLIAILEWVEPCYFEVEACLTSLIRAYELLRFHISQIVLPDLHAPDSYKIMLEKISSRTPTSPRESFIKNLVMSTESEFRKMKDYRNCLQHNTYLSAPISRGMLNNLGDGVWGFHLPLPDNPRCRSFEGFTFHQRLDALTYCWDATTSSVIFIEKLTKYLWQKEA